ncbi:MAG: hypothetical protein G3M70_10600 [Candidatus Nitronauta litoralis]|uniref:Intradiol ring-cleavage dioxygenases domain-containing protein n=1 Tax=Candidatus Nitronauta litoralis TaxID=2705533 RepID=A0A7T0BWN2_9BACT|nr:MAG: hypothetical protein G3M70_10600 [Candidatus Nitronauta litoralis]
MKNKTNMFSRRNFLRTGLGTVGAAAGTLITNSAFGQMLNLKTPRQTLGPFFPDDGDPVHEVRENLDFRLPISEANDNDLTLINGHQETARGQVVYIKGKVLFKDSDNTKSPLPGAVLIMWNASASGRYNHRGDTDAHRFQHPITGEWIERKLDENFQHWGRCITDAEGNYWFKTVVPGFYPVRIGKDNESDKPSLGNSWYRPPHLHFMVTAPGIPQLVTQLYFKGNQIEHNDFIQKLNAKDAILRSERLTQDEQENIIIEYKKDRANKITDGLVGNYDFVLTF